MKMQGWPRRAVLAVPVGALAVVGAVLISPGGVPVADAQTPSLSCSAYRSQAAAQAAFRANPVRLAGLDTNGNGIACETRPAPYDRTPVRVTRAPAPAPAARAVAPAAPARPVATAVRAAAPVTRPLPAMPRTGAGPDNGGLTTAQLGGDTAAVALLLVTGLGIGVAGKARRRTNA